MILALIAIAYVAQADCADPNLVVQVSPPPSSSPQNLSAAPRRDNRQSGYYRTAPSYYRGSTVYPPVPGYPNYYSYRAYRQFPYGF